MQIGGSTTRRLQNDEHPFMLQDDFLKKIGYLDASRRARLCIDPDLKYMLRFYLGPAEAQKCKYGVTKSGTIEILKGLVFPQWQKRSVAIVGHQLLVYSGAPIEHTRFYFNIVALIRKSIYISNKGNASITPQMFDLAGGHIAEHSPGYNRLILKVVPKICYDSNRSMYGLPTPVNNNNNSDCSVHCNLNLFADGLFYSNNSNSMDNAVYNSTCSINSSNGNGCDRENVLFFGFEESWERDLWSAWLVKVSGTLSLHLMIMM